MPYDFTTWDRNCVEEQSSPITGNVSGSIPGWLRGSLIMNGPGRMKFGDQEYQHVFDGQALLQKINFTETGPVYSSKFIRSTSFQINSESEQIVVSEFGTKGTPPTNKTVLQKLGSKFAFDKLFSDNAPLNIVRYGGVLYANTEAPFLQRIDADTLDTLGKVDLHKELGVLSQCPHPITLSDGSSLSLFNDVGATGPRYDIYKFPPTPPAGKSDVFYKSTKIASIDARWKLNPCHMHSFGVTDKHMILIEQPLTIDVKALVANTVKDRPFIEGMEWIKEKQVKFHVISLDSGKELKIKFKTEPFCYLHIVNCYEENGHIILDLCSFKRPDLIYTFFLKKLREKGDSFWSELDHGLVNRYVLPLTVNDKASPDENQVKLAGSKATAKRQKDESILLVPEALAPVCYENPTMHPDYISKKYNFFYGASGDMTDSCGKVGKIDLRSGEVKLWSQSGLYACIQQFVPRPNATAEDDGVVLVSCLHGGAEQQKTTVIVLDASTMSETGSVTFNTPSAAPRSLHGIFIPA